MTTQDYIKLEIKLMRRQCQSMRMDPAEWVERYARTYHQRFSKYIKMTQKASKY